MKERRPIFYDAERVRWRRTRRVLEISGILLTLLLAYFFITIAVSVELPAGLLPDTRPTYRALKSKIKKVPAREGRHRRISNIGDRKSTRLNSSHLGISYAVFCLKKKQEIRHICARNQQHKRDRGQHH